MDQAEFHFKEYERTLSLLDQSERSLDRLVLVRMLFLVGAFLFFRNYLVNFNEIQNIRSKLDNLATTDKESTVFGFITAHQKIENSVFVPDENAKSLIALLPKLSSFLGEDLTLENQASRAVSEILLKATKKPERISIENQYLPKLSVPVSYSALALFVFLIILASYFNVAFRRFRIGLLISYLEYHLKRFQDLSSFDKKDMPFVRPRLYLRRLAPGRSRTMDEGHTAARTRGRMPRIHRILGSLVRSMLEIDAESPLRFLSLVVTLCLFIAVSVLTVEIIAGESGLPRGWALDAVYIFILTFIPSLALHRLNEFVKGRFNREPFPVLPPSDDI